MADHDLASYWNRVAERVGRRRDGEEVAGDDAGYWRYKRERFVERLLPKVPVEGRSVLEVGCGPGGNLEQLARRRPSRLAGCDVAPAMVEIACRRVPLAEVALIDGRRLPYADGEFEVVMTATVLQHNADDGAGGLLGEICRVASSTVVLFEDTRPMGGPAVVGRLMQRVDGAAGDGSAGRHGNFFPRPVSWYCELAASGGMQLAEVESLATFVSHATDKVLSAVFERGRPEGCEPSRPHVAVGGALLPLTRRLDPLVHLDMGELHMMRFVRQAA